MFGKKRNVCNLNKLQNTLLNDTVHVIANRLVLKSRDLPKQQLRCSIITLRGRREEAREDGREVAGGRSREGGQFPKTRISSSTSLLLFLIEPVFIN